MNQKIIFSVVFLVSLIGLKLAGFSNWIILSVIVHVTWITITSNKIIQLDISINKKIILLSKFNKILVFLLIADMVIIFLSMSFFFRLIFTMLYRPIFIISFVGILISLACNYFIIIKFLNKKIVAFNKRVLLLFSSLFYIIGIWTFDSELLNNNNSQTK